MQNGDDASPSIILAGRALLLKMPIPLESRGAFGSIFVYLCILKHCPATGMQNGDEASTSIILADRALLEKMLITLGPHGIFCSNFLYLCILTLSSHWYAKR